MGETKAGLLTQRLLTDWQPHTVVVLGIAAGLGGDVAVGDVVAATVVDSYLQNSKAVDSTVGPGFTFEVSGDLYRPSADLVNEVRHFRFAHQSAFKSWQQSGVDQLAAELEEEQLKRLLEKRTVRSEPRIEQRSGSSRNSSCIARGNRSLAFALRRSLPAGPHHAGMGNQGGIGLLSIALDHLTLGRTYLLECQVSRLAGKEPNSAFFHRVERHPPRASPCCAEPGRNTTCPVA